MDVLIGYASFLDLGRAIRTAAWRFRPNATVSSVPFVPILMIHVKRHAGVTRPEGGRVPSSCYGQPAWVQRQ